MLHELKTVPWYFRAVKDGTKRFEVRKNDRPFQVGDVLRLREFVPEGEDDERQEAHYTGDEVFVRVLYKTDFEQKEGFVVLSISNPV